MFNWVATGEYSGIGIADFPDAATAATFVATVESTGSFTEFKAIEILTSGEIDRALGKSMTYRPLACK